MAQKQQNNPFIYEMLWLGIERDVLEIQVTLVWLQSSGAFAARGRVSPGGWGWGSRGRRFRFYPQGDGERNVLNSSWQVSTQVLGRRFSVSDGWIGRRWEGAGGRVSKSFRNSRRGDNRALIQAWGLARKDVTVANQRKPAICFMPSDLLENYWIVSKLQK